MRLGLTWPAAYEPPCEKCLLRVTQQASYILAELTCACREGSDEAASSVKERPTTRHVSLGPLKSIPVSLPLSLLGSILCLFVWVHGYLREEWVLFDFSCRACVAGSAGTANAEVWVTVDQLCVCVCVCVCVFKLDFSSEMCVDVTTYPVEQRSTTD